MTAPPSDATSPETKPDVADVVADTADAREISDGESPNGSDLATATRPAILPPEPPGDEPPGKRGGRVAERIVAPWTRRRIGVVGAAWVLITVICAALVCYGLGPLTESRHQRALLADMRGKIARAVGAQESLFSGKQVTSPPEIGDSVAILQIPRLRLQQVVQEGADPKTTQGGPGHIPGTAGPGQPGNSAVVARRYGFGAPFHKLGSLRPGDSVIISTVQGQSVYTVQSVTRKQSFAHSDPYAASTDDRLTLVSSSSAVPWEGRHGVVVVATMSGLPYPATPQAGRSRLQNGRHNDTAAVALIVLYGALFAAAAASAVLLYRRWLSLSTYLITAPILIALIVLAAEATIRLLPAWT